MSILPDAKARSSKGKILRNTFQATSTWLCFILFPGCIYFSVMPLKINITHSPVELIIAFTVRSSAKILPLPQTLSSLHGNFSCLFLEQMIFGSSFGQLVPFLYYGCCEVFYRLDFLFFLFLLAALKIRTKFIYHSYFYSHFCLQYVFLPLFSLISYLSNLCCICE